MGNESAFTINSTIELKFKSEELCEIAYVSYLPEFNIKKSLRSETSLEKIKNSLAFNISSNDITAFRASVNEIISFGKIVENTYQLYVE